MNFSAIAIQIARHAVLRAHEGHGHAFYAIYEAIVFAWLALEALLNEQAYIEVVNLGHGEKNVHDALDRGAGGFKRVQAILTYFYGRGLKDGEQPANDLKHLISLRHGLSHYRFEGPPTSTLDQLAQRGLMGKDWSEQQMISWPMTLTNDVAHWAYETTCDTAHAIADLLPSDDYHANEADLIRNNFDRNIMP